MFLKNIENFVWIPKQYLLGFFLLEINLLIFWTGVSCFSVTLFYSTLLALTDWQKDGQRVKYTCYAWAGGTFFPVVLLCWVSFLFWWEIGVLHTTYVLRVPYSCAVVSVFCCGGKANLVQIFLLNLRIFFLYFLLCMDLQPYSHNSFSKISRTLFDFRNTTYWVSLF